MDRGRLRVGHRLATALVVGLAVTALAALAGCGSDDPTTTDGAEDGSPPTLLLLGDSVMQEVAAGVDAAFGPAVETTYVGTPTLGDDLHFAEEWERLRAEDPPELVVVMVGTWELLLVSEQSEWEASYRRNLDPIVRAITEDSELVWLIHPPLQDPASDARLDQLTAIWADLPHQYDGVSTLDAGRAVAPDGEFHTLLTVADGRELLVRQLDGRHLCPEGVVLVAGAVIDEVGPLLGADPQPGWEDGAWRDDELVFPNPELCPLGLGSG